MELTPDMFAVALVVLFGSIQLFYYLFYFIRLALFRGKPTEVQEQKPVSIIISAFNEEANLKKNIALWLEQDYYKNDRPYFEVVVVNDNSEDDTFYFLNTLQPKYPHLHIVNLTQEAKLIPGKKFPLSMGIKSARYERLLLTDADCSPSSNQWLKRMNERLSDRKKIVLGYGPYTKHKGWLNKCIRFETAHSAMQYLSYALAGNAYMGVGRNLSYLRELFNNNKGFSSHHHIASGDDDLFINQVATKNNVAICIDPDSFVYSEPKKTRLEWHYQKKRHLSTGKFYKFKHRFLLGLYALSHAGFWFSLILAIVFHHYLLITVIAFATRWLIQFIIYQRIFTKLKENDLIWFIWLFDVWLLWYHIKSVPAIFFKSKNKWR
ncbi:MAG: glycosyltransferase [Chitinophagaceae bacterium]|nr:glycosyltransferase [Chitinophagaceae bacterium]